MPYFLVIRLHSSGYHLKVRVRQLACVHV
jgi:hypothetical protein